MATTAAAALTTVKVGSKDCERMFPFNSAENFTCKLIEPLTFDCPMEVGMSSIAFTAVPQQRSFFRGQRQFISLDFSRDYVHTIGFRRTTDDIDKFLKLLNSALAKSSVAFTFEKRENDFKTLPRDQVVPLPGQSAEKTYKIVAINQLSHDVKLEKVLAEALGFTSEIIAVGTTVAPNVYSDKKFKNIEMTTELYFESEDPHFSNVVVVNEPLGYSFEDLITNLNLALLAYGIKIVFSGPREIILSSHYNVVMSFTEELAFTLGTDSIRLAGGQNYNLHTHQSLHHPNPLLVVQTNVVTPWQYGDLLLPVLKTLLHAQDTTPQLIHFKTPEFFPVPLNVVNEIEIRITNELNQPADFRGFPVDITLVFRPIKVS